MSRPQAPKSAKPNDSSRLGVAARTAAAGGNSPSKAQLQLSSFEAAMKLFHSRDLKEARALFEAAAQGPERDVAQRARLHIAMCDRRLQNGAVVNLGSAEDHYNYGIALINSRNLGEARLHLENGLKIAPGADHIHYALALAHALSGDVPGACEHLRRAIELEPRNRLLARQDADLAHLAHQPALHELLYPEKHYPR